MKHGPFFYALYTGVACIIIMVLLQPFGIDRVEHYKYPIIVGYAVLSAITYLLASLLTTYALRMPRREEWDFKRNIAVGLLICPIAGCPENRAVGQTFENIVKFQDGTPPGDHGVNRGNTLFFSHSGLQGLVQDDISVKLRPFRPFRDPAARSIRSALLLHQDAFVFQKIVQ